MEMGWKWDGNENKNKNKNKKKSGFCPPTSFDLVTSG